MNSIAPFCNPLVWGVTWRPTTENIYLDFKFAATKMHLYVMAAVRGHPFTADTPFLWHNLPIGYHMYIFLDLQVNTEFIMARHKF